MYFCSSLSTDRSPDQRRGDGGGADSSDINLYSLSESQGTLLSFKQWRVRGLTGMK